VKRLKHDNKKSDLFYVREKNYKLNAGAYRIYIVLIDFTNVTIQALKLRSRTLKPLKALRNENALVCFIVYVTLH